MFMAKLPLSFLQELKKGSFVNTDLGKSVVNGLANVNLQVASLMNSAGILDEHGMFKPRGLLSKGQPDSSPIDPGNSSYIVSGSPVAPQTIDYLNAELAQHYGMGRSTAYQEALSNTAYQRAVKDMQAAGLNPAAIFGSGKGYTAGGVGYVDSGSSGGVSARSSGSGSNKKLLSEGMYYGLSTAVGLATAALTKNPANYWIGSYATQGALGALNSMFKK